MQPIRTLTSRTVVLPFTNVDTDQISEEHTSELQSPI